MAAKDYDAFIRAPHEPINRPTSLASLNKTEDIFFPHENCVMMDSVIVTNHPKHGQVALKAFHQSPRRRANGHPVWLAFLIDDFSYLILIFASDLTFKVSFGLPFDILTFYPSSASVRLDPSFDHS